MGPWGVATRASLKGKSHLTYLDNENLIVLLIGAILSRRGIFMHYLVSNMFQVDPSVVPRARYPSKPAMTRSHAYTGTYVIKGGNR
jgi:hypothetical protein